MIVFDLRCAPTGHVFEAWFGSTGDYESQQERGLVACPLCGSGDVHKAVMAPRLGAKGNREIGGGAEASPMALAEPEAAKKMLAAMAAVQKEILGRSAYVGDRFADEARAIHVGEAAARSIYGKATPVEAQALADEGISVLPLPFPVAEPGQEN